MARWTRWEASSGTTPAPSPETRTTSPGSPTTVAEHVSHTPSAQPMESKPGPRLALLAETSTSTPTPTRSTSELISPLEAEGVRDAHGVDGHAHRSHLGSVFGPQGPLGILQSVTRDRADDRGIRRD